MSKPKSNAMVPSNGGGDSASAGPLVTTPDGGAVAVVPMGRDVTADDLARYQITHVVTLAEGQAITGYFFGEGAPIRMEDPGGRPDPATGEVPMRDVRTWQIMTPQGVIARLIGSAGLDKYFVDSDGNPTKDAELWARLKVDLLVVRGPQTTTRKGFRVNQYIVAPAKP